MLECIQCGHNLHKEVNFCPECGCRIKGESKELSVSHRLIKISSATSSRPDLDSLLNEISLCACDLTHAETGSTMLYDSERDELYFKVALGEKKDVLRRLTIRSYPPSIAWWVFKNGVPTIVNDTASDPRFSGNVDKITEYKTKNILCVPIIHALNGSSIGNVASTKVIGVIEVINKLSNPPQFSCEDKKVLSILSYLAGIVVRNAQGVSDRRNFFLNAIEIFIKAIESTGFVEPGHCMRVSRNSMVMAHTLGLEQNSLHDLYYASALHDIGILDIRCRQGPSPGKGCSELHPIIGAEMVRPVNLLAGAENIIRHHHEFWDGSGYPDGLKGSEIELEARIVAVAEAYEEIGMQKEFIVNNAGRLFDPDVVDAFLKMEQ